MYWSAENEGMPWEYGLMSNQKVYFSCDCGHDFKSIISNVARKTWCPFCGTNKGVLCDDDECKQCYNLSFASHPKAIHWSPLNGISPRNVTYGTPTLYKFNCDKCMHVFEQSPNHITNKNK